MAFVDQDIDGLELCDIAVTLELLPHLGADSRDGHVQGVHGLDLGSLYSCAIRQSTKLVFHNFSDIPSCSSIPVSTSPGVFVPRAASPGMT